MGHRVDQNVITTTFPLRFARSYCLPLVEVAENCGAIDPVLSADCDNADVAKDRAIELIKKSFFINIDVPGEAGLTLKRILFKQNK
jgi:hypothetical protein